MSRHMDSLTGKDFLYDGSIFDLSQAAIQRTMTNDTYFYSCPKMTSCSSSSSLPELFQQSQVNNSNTLERNPEKRKVNLRLPAFGGLGHKPDRAHTNSKGEKAVLRGSSSGDQISLQAPKFFYGATPLLTPPPEDDRVLKQSCILPLSSPAAIVASAGDQTQQEQTQISAGSAPVSTSYGLVLPPSTNVSDPSQISGNTWVMRASSTILSHLNSVQPLHQVQLVSQTMPSQARDGRSKPTFEDVLEAIQVGMDSSPFVTITHAVPQVRIMEELPKTPPSTPNARHEINDYFGGDQTIFVHAAVVPIYHNHGHVDAISTSRLPHHIAAPYTVQVSILERYIPPTMPSEVTDFFSLSSRSYLADRLSELSAHNGSLLLVYPTRVGGQTFTRKYVGPVIDPLLRQFILLNNLTSDAAAMMGVMTAVEQMLDFDEMKQKVESLCRNLTQRPAIRGQRSVYRVTQCESTSVVLDRATWVNWFVEQEQPRLRQNLVEYHKSGGRMPGASGHKEITTGMLTREIVDGIQKSREVAGNADIEVGVFIIMRSTVA